MDSYNPYSWETTSDFTPTKMNNIEQGIFQTCLSDSIAPAEQSDSSASAYSIGDCFIFKGKRVKATSSIAIGDTIAVGTNCTREDIQTEIEDIKLNVANNDLTHGGEIAGNLNVCIENSTTTNVDTYITVGNTTPTGVEGASRGALGLYSRSDKVAVLVPSDLTADRIIYLPDKAGTLAMGDISTEQTNSEIKFGIFNTTVVYNGSTYTGVQIAGMKITSTAFTPERWTIFGYVIAGTNLYGRFVCISSTDTTHAIVVVPQ